MQSDRLLQLLANKWSGEITEDELQELEQLLKAYPHEFEKEQLLASFFQQKEAKNLDTSRAKAKWQQHLEHMKKEFPDDFATSMQTTNMTVENPPRHIFSLWKKLAIAASIIGVISIVLLKYSGKDQQQNGSSLVAQTSSTTISAAKGNRIIDTLPDGTIVWLNGNSHIEYNENFGKEKREITLSGEAFFDVAHNAAVPLIVHAKTVNITVKGTAFNVKAYPEDSRVEASLIRGSIELMIKKSQGKKILLHPSEKITIETNEIADAGNNKKEKGSKSIEPYHIAELKVESQSNLIPEISWMQNKLVFDSETFEDIIPKMEKWYDITINSDDKELMEQRFSAVFEKETITEALTALQYTYNFRFEIKDKQVFIYKK
ncbi:MAG: FecR family protein [Ferruginibacter sp.]